MAKKSTKILFPINHEVHSLGSSWVEVVKRSNGWYVTTFINKGRNSQGPEICSTKASAIRKAEAIRRNY